MRVLVLLALLGSAAAQGNLNSFSAIRNALRSGEELQLNADTDQCSEVTNLNGTLLISLPLRNWQIIKDDDGERIRSDDYYVSTMDASASYIIRNLFVYADDSVTVTLTSTLDLGAPVTMTCDLGQGATVHRVIPGNDIETIDTYNEVKSLLLMGSHVEAVSELRACRNADEVLPDGEEIVLGYQINRFSVYNDGTDLEYIAFDDVAVLGADASDVTIGTETVILYPDDTVTLAIAILDPSLQQLTSFTLDCDLGNAMSFTIHERESEETFTTYAEIREATLDGHDMEAIVFLELCENDGTVDLTGQIGSARFDQFQLLKPGGMWGDVEYIAFSTYGLGADGTLYADVLRVAEDEVVTIEYFVVAPGAGTESGNGMLKCPLADAALFHSVKRTRAPVGNYTEIIADIQDRGQTFEVEIDYDGCETAGNVTFGSIFGGIVWQTYIDPSETDGFYFGNVFALVQEDISNTPAPAWNAAGILLQPDNSVTITVALYDYFTGENLVAEMLSEPIRCSLATGDGEGSVSFYRYP